MSINHTRTLNVVLLYMYIESIFVLYVTLPLRGSLIGTIKKKYYYYYNTFEIIKE